MQLRNFKTTMLKATLTAAAITSVLSMAFISTPVLAEAATQAAPSPVEALAQKTGLMLRGIPDSTAAFLTETLIAQSINDDRIQVAKPDYKVTVVTRADELGATITCRRFHVVGTPPEYACVVTQK